MRVRVQAIVRRMAQAVMRRMAVVATATRAARAVIATAAVFRAKGGGSQGSVGGVKQFFLASRQKSDSKQQGEGRCPHLHYIFHVRMKKRGEKIGF
jgi:hypothetical protein